MWVGERGSRAGSTLAKRARALLAIAGAAWPPEQRERGRLASRALRYASASQHPRTRGDRLSHCRQICLRLRPPLDLYDTPRCRDARALWKRAAPPPRQVEPASLALVKRRIAAAPAMQGVGLAAMWGSFARPSDWLGSRDAGRPPVQVKDLTMRGRGVVEVIYWRTKPDVEGVGRRVAFAMPSRQYRLLDRRVRRAPPDAPALPVTFAQLRHALGEPLRSIRRGAVRAALLSGVSVRAIMALTGHKDRRTVLRYAGLIAPEDARRGIRASSAAWGRSPRSKR